jgi:hypothetical protein
LQLDTACAEPAANETTPRSAAKVKIDRLTVPLIIENPFLDSNITVLRRY